MKKKQILSGLSGTVPEISFENSMLGATLSKNRKKLNKILKEAEKGKVVRIM